MAIPSFVNQGTRVSQSFGATITPPLPASITTGNLLLAIVSGFVAGGARDYTWPAGWTEILKHESTGSNTTIAYRIATGSDSAPTVTWTGGNTSADGKILQYTGNLASALAIGANSASFSNAATTTWTQSSVVTTTNNARVLAIYTGSGFGDTVSQPTGFDAADTNTGNEATIAVFGKDMATSGGSSPAISQSKS